MSVRNLEYLFHPRSVAVIGTSSCMSSLGAMALANLRNAGFAGPIYPVDPDYRDVSGRREYGRLADIETAPDLAVICAPLAAVPALIAELGTRGTRAAIVMTGSDESAENVDEELCRTLLEAAQPHLMRVLGPGSTGLLVPAIKLNASVAPVGAAAGRIAFVTQFGALTGAMLDWARARSIGFSHCVSLGASLDVDAADVIDYLAHNAEARAILLHLENIQAARKFMSALRAAARNKPVIVIRSGRFAETTDTDEVYGAVLRRAGALRVTTVEELFDAAATLARDTRVSGERLAILTNGSSLGTLAADALAAGCGRLAQPVPETLARIRAVSSTSGARDNPLDVAFDAVPEHHAQALQALLADPECDAVLQLYAPSRFAQSEAVALACVSAIGDARHRLLACWMGVESMCAARAMFDAAGIATYDSPEDAVRAFQHLVEHRYSQLELIETPPSPPQEFVPDAVTARRVVEEALARGNSCLSESEVRSVLAAYEIPVLAGKIAAHRKQCGALELLAGMTVDKRFGPVITFGSGGLTAAAINDRAVALAPLNLALARALIARTRVTRLFAGGDGRLTLDVDAVCLVLIKVAQLAADVAGIAAIEINPLLADADGIAAAAARIHVAAGAGGIEHMAILPYPKELEEWIDLAGRRVLLRAIRPEDGPAHQTFFEHLDPEDVALRFFHRVKSFSPLQAAAFTQIDYSREMAFIATARDAAGNAETLGVARAVADPDNLAAEFAIIVRSDIKGRGLGRKLMEKLLRYSASHGTGELWGEVLVGNLPMLALANALGFSARSVGDGVVRVAITLGKSGGD